MKNKNKKMTEGEKLYITAHYGFDYNNSYYDNLIQFDILTQFFEHRNNLQGFISDEQGDRIEEYSEVAILMDSLYEAFDNRDIPGTVNRYLHEFEMYEVLKDYSEPTSIEGLLFKEELKETYHI